MQTVKLKLSRELIELGEHFKVEPVIVATAIFDYRITVTKTIKVA